MGSARRKVVGRSRSRELSKARKAVQEIIGVASIEIRTDLPQEEKISNALAVLLDAEIGKGARLADYRMALQLIAIAWNISLLPANERLDAIEKAFRLSPAGDDAMKREAVAHVERVIAKKQELFPDDKRWIVSCEANLRRDHIHITATALHTAAAAA